MGVLVPTGDMVAVKRTAQFFLNSFYERLEVQKSRKETQGEEYNKEFKTQRTKVMKCRIRTRPRVFDPKGGSRSI
jgi:hypothetical protein